MNVPNQKYVDVAKLHIDCIKTGFLPSLGVRFLALMYRCIDEGDFSTLFVKYKDKQLIGFVTGTNGKSNLYRLMINYPLELFLSLVPIIIDLQKIKKIINILTHMSGKERKNYPSAELLTICVHQDFRRLGVADDLYLELCEHFKSESISQFVIIVGQSLKANLFYVNQGAKVAGELQVHKGTTSNVYIQGV
ncbi:MAG: GNAT family N-acetyltransferase [Gammaproteobacteria bacterium]|tara:strand:- start:270 stop:845 length:576 start_codon:yes stop_codon:yes gene_type:complete